MNLAIILPGFFMFYNEVTTKYVIARNEATALTIDSASEIASFLAKTLHEKKQYF
jgi:hypothetical protein